MENGALIVLTIVVFFGLAFVLAAGGAIWYVFRERIGVSTDLELAGRLDRLESKQQQLRDEWESTRSNLDTIVRRGIRLKVLEGRKSDDVVDTTPHNTDAPRSRGELLRRALASGKAKVNE